jgi:FkbM family methyltransferase
MTIHFPLEIEVIDTSFNEIKPYTNEGQSMPINIAQINHYFCKTYPEFLQKIERGRADSKCKRAEYEFNGFNKNEIEDYSAFNFLYKKENIIQIGCNIGNDHVFDYVRNNIQNIKNIILVDANYKCIDMCEKNYNSFSNYIKTFNIAIVANDQECVELFVPDNNETSEQSSIIENNVLDHLKYINCESYSKLKVNSLNINQFLSNLNLSSIDKLYVDIEGLDVDIVSIIDYKKFNIKYLNFEHIHSDGAFSNFNGEYTDLLPRYKKCLDVLYSFDYKIIKEGYNTVAIKFS